MMTRIDPERITQGETVSPADVIQPIPLVREVPPPSPYPVHALEPLRSAVEAVRAWNQAPVAIPAQSALSVAALALQGHADVETLGGRRPLSLYCLTIATSGERKSSCDEKLMAAMKDFERDQAHVHAEQRKAWDIDRAIWKAKHDKVLGEVKKGKQDRKELAALGPEPAAPPLPDRLVSEPTYEGLTRLYAQGQPSLGLFHDEGGQFLGGHAMGQDNRQKTLAALNDLWMGNPIKRTRQGDGAFTLYGRRLSSHLMVQPGIAHALLADPLASDSGFLARCLICEPDTTIGTRLYALSRRDQDTIDAFGERLGDILNTGMAMDPDTRELKPRLLPLSADARARLIAFHDSVELSQAPGGEMEAIRGHASKSAEQAARMAGVLTLWRDIGAQEVSGEAMANGIDLARFYLLEAARLAGAAMISEGVAKAVALHKWLLSAAWGKPWVTIREIVRLGPNRLRESPEAKRAVQLLVEHGWLVAMEPGTMIESKARKEAWRVIRP